MARRQNTTGVNGGPVARRAAALVAAALMAASLAFAPGCAGGGAATGGADETLEANDRPQTSSAEAMTLLSGEETAAPQSYDPASLADEGIAAVAGSTVVLAADVDDAIASERAVRGIADDAEWESYLAEQGLTPQEYRTDVLEGFVRRAVVHEAAVERGVAVSDAAFEEAFEALKAELGDTWGDALAGAGLTEDGYRPVYRAYLDEAALVEALAADGTLDGADDVEAFETWYRQACDDAPVVYADADAA